jgi:polar amino acid transport system substrate-binding protein
MGGIMRRSLPGLRQCLDGVAPTLIVVFMSAALVRADQTPNLAPTGTLRAAFLATNPVHARTDAKTGDVTGPVPDLVRELARRLQTPFVLVPAANATAVIGHVQAGTADVGFLAYDEARAREVDFVGAFLLMFNTYAVAAASPLREAADADRQGIRIGGVKGQTPQIYLSGTLRNARMRVFESTPDQAALEQLLVSGDVDAFALNRQRAEEAATASQGRLRALQGSFFDAEQSVVVRKGEAEKAVYLRAFVEDLKASGFLEASIDRAKLVGVGVAPPRR